MKFATVQTSAGIRVLVESNGDRWFAESSSVSSFLSSGEFATDTKQRNEDSVGEDWEFLPAVTDPGKVICVGHNYRAHILEMGHPLPEYPNVFSKFRQALIGPHDEIVLDPISTQWDWEAELALVIGLPVRRASNSQASAAIAGYTIANDVSARDWQKRASQWLLGKTFETTTPLGPWIVTPDEFNPEDGARITCTVDGEVKQDSNVRDLVFSPVDLVAYLSQVMTLEPGDVILTGTPGGVGAARNPQEWLAPGSELVTTIEGLGQCRNVCSLP